MRLWLVRTWFGMRAKAMGARVVVTEVKPVRALEAAMDGFEVIPSPEAAKVGDVFVTITGDKNVIDKEHFQLMKDGAIMANSGHFNVEINIPALESISKKKETIRPFAGTIFAEKTAGNCSC